jgi:hypothetical protein
MLVSFWIGVFVRYEVMGGDNQEMELKKNWLKPK